MTPMRPVKRVRADQVEPGAVIVGPSVYLDGAAWIQVLERMDASVLTHLRSVRPDGSPHQMKLAGSQLLTVREDV